MASEKREAKDRKISASADLRILWKPLIMYPPQQHITHWPVSNWKRNRRRVQHSFDGSTFFHCYCPKAELQSTNWEAIGSQQEDKFPSIGEDACLFLPRKLFKVKFPPPCWGKQRSPMNSLASVYSNPSAFLENGKLSSCLKDSEDIWPICSIIYFFNFLLCFVTANRYNKYHTVKEKQGIDTLGWLSTWIYKKPTVILKLKYTSTYCNY